MQDTLTQTKKEKKFDAIESKAYLLLCQVRGKTVYHERIYTICHKGSIREFRELIKELQKVDNTNSTQLFGILGWEAYKAFKNLIEQ